jgi:hypothetical protein
MTPTYTKHVNKRPRPEEEDPISEIEEDLAVMDTLTSSQQQLVVDHEMADSDEVELVKQVDMVRDHVMANADDEVEFVEPPIPTKAMVARSKRNVTPDIPMDWLLVAGTNHPTHPATATHVSLATKIAPHVLPPPPCQSIPSKNHSDPEEQHHPISPSGDQQCLNSRRQDMHAKVQQFLTDTEEARREVTAEVSVVWYTGLDIQ